MPRACISPNCPVDDASAPSQEAWLENCKLFHGIHLSNEIHLPSCCKIKTLSCGSHSCTKQSSCLPVPTTALSPPPGLQCYTLHPGSPSTCLAPPFPPVKRSIASHETNVATYGGKTRHWWCAAESVLMFHWGRSERYSSQAPGGEAANHKPSPLVPLNIPIPGLSAKRKFSHKAFFSFCCSHSHILSNWIWSQCVINCSFSWGIFIYRPGKSIVKRLLALIAG